MPRGNCPHFHLRKETDQVSETLRSFRVLDDEQSPDTKKSRIFKNVPERNEFLGREFLIEKIKIAALVKNSAHFMVQEDLLPYSEDPMTGIYPESPEYKK
jgi:hypothetical protein